MTALELVALLFGLSLLIVASALFSGLETALFALKPHQLRRLGSNHPALGKFIELFRQNPRRVLNMLLLGDGLVKVPLILLCLVVLWRTPVAIDRPQWLIGIVIFAIVVLFCDLIPKLFALSAPYRLSAMAAFTLRVSMPLLDRVGHGLETFSTALVEFFVRSTVPSQPLSDDEFETIVEIGEEEGALHEAEAEMIQEIIKLGDKTAKDCMTPRVDAFMLPDDLTNEEAIRQMRERRHRRVPVYVDTPDQVIGILDVKNFMVRATDHYTEALIAPSFVPETMRALELLKLFLSHAQELAVVVDEYGGTEGIISTSDIVEEILSDAVPTGEKEFYIESLGKGRFLVSGNARLDDVSEQLGFDLEAEGIDTIGGLVFNRLGYLPPSGTQLEIPRLAITVRRTGRKRIEEILLQKTSGGSETADDGEQPGEDAA